ncbi:MAG: pentapeptide repeat-containing protein [Caulobacteraceae bacterium]
MSNAVLDEADLRGADLTAAKLQGASFRQTDLSLVVGLERGDEF